MLIGRIDLCETFTSEEEMEEEELNAGYSASERCNMWIGSLADVTLRLSGTQRQRKACRRAAYAAHSRDVTNASGPGCDVALNAVDLSDSTAQFC